ncbi:putative thiamine pyrophosphokinase [Rosellinia necatrix]|uniref:Putative thiamine pyrophosphokinase n=1 Tax=Rosellinia necatrix TaxID=77044 RepID=A0A1S7UNX6_ROSNE|nr:putative thiamine pyrophosphokinase [Rosellinia necatrix]
MSSETKTYLQLVKECDTLPYPDEVEEYARVTSGYYHFRLKKAWKSGGPGNDNDDDDASSPSYTTVGYILPSVAAAMPWTDKFRVDHAKQTISIPYVSDAAAGAAATSTYETDALAEQLSLARARDSIPILRKWRAEAYRVLGLADGREVLIARAGSAVFGVHTVGVHMLGFQRIPSSSPSSSSSSSPSSELRLWIARRSHTKQTFPGMLDNTVGGGLTAEDTGALACLVREAAEEASLPAAWVRARARPVGSVSYFSVRDERAGGPDEVGLLQPATQVLYDLEMPGGVVPRPRDGEVAEFLLWTPDQTMRALRAGRFKLNSAVAWIDFLVRHGCIAPQDEPDYLELVARLHRRICF